MSVKFRFFYSLILFSAVLFMAGYLLFSTLLSDYFLPVFYFLVFYFMVLTFAGRLVVMKSNPGKPEGFNTRYFLVRWAKVFLHLVFIIVYLLNARDNILPFVLTFMTGYILFSVFDIYTLGFYLKKSNQS
ncbi:MAG: hypothetical protein R6U58_13100 [Bacteroidales bacterium]